MHDTDSIKKGRLAVFFFFVCVSAAFGHRLLANLIFSPRRKKEHLVESRICFCLSGIMTT
jgi:hypothetical protein